MPVFLTVFEVAKIVKRKPRTVRRWMLQGVFPTARKIKNRDWLIPEPDLNRFLLTGQSPADFLR